MPRPPTLSSELNSTSHWGGGRSEYGALTALAGPGGQGHRYNAVGSHGVRVCASSSKAHRCEASEAGSDHAGAAAVRVEIKEIKETLLHSDASSPKAR